MTLSLRSLSRGAGPILLVVTVLAAGMSLFFGGRTTKAYLESRASSSAGIDVLAALDDEPAVVDPSPSSVLTTVGTTTTAAEDEAPPPPSSSSPKAVDSANATDLDNATVVRNTTAANAPPPTTTTTMAPRPTARPTVVAPPPDLNATDRNATDLDNATVVRNATADLNNTTVVPNATDLNATTTMDYPSSLTPRELAYDPVRKGAPPRPMREPSGSNSAASNNATWEFVKLRVGVRTTGDVEKREVTAVHDREVLETWCPQPASRVLETPRMIVAADYRYEGSTHPHYAALDYRSFYADAGLIIDKLFELVAGDPPPANAIVGDNVTALNISTKAVPEPKVHKAAICRIRDWTNVLLQHFAHAMEEIYMCFGYWVESGALSNTTDVTPVLLYNGATQGKYLMDSAFLTNTFMKGIKEFLTTELGLVILKQEDYYRCHFPRAAWDIPTAAGSARALQMADLCDSLYHPDQTIRTHNVKGKYGYFFEHVAEWNQLMTRWLNRKDVLRELRKATRKKTAKPPVSGTSSANGSNLENHDRQQQQRRRLTGLTERGVTKPETVLRESLNGACFRPPRIAILNRRKTRVVLNADELATDLSELVYVYRKTDGTNKTHQIRAQHPAEVNFFEDKEFIEQVEFFRRTDILISAHGAQLTGLPFMATDLVGGKSCKQVLELYPKDYGLPYYFGSLAVQSGLEHNYVYYDDGLDMVYNLTGPALPIPPRKDHLRDRKPLVELKPWETLTSKEYMGRAAARGYKFCPRRDDAVDYVAALIADWYRCHGCGTATTALLR